MKGSMMDYPLTLQTILERIPKTYPSDEIFTRMPDAGMQRKTYHYCYRRNKE
jgi:fatty-acyl-CoA synthase